jgi:large subunit ribosomal protein L13
MQKSYTMKAGEIDKKWFIVDVEGKVLGRVASEIAKILKGKTKPTFTPHMDMGDFVIVINAEKVVLTGNKDEDKEYFFHSGYPGGDKFKSVKKFRAENPAFIIEHAVKGMLPKGPLGRKIFGNLKVYKGKEHPHTAQKPVALEIK